MTRSEALSIILSAPDEVLDDILSQILPWDTAPPATKRAKAEKIIDSLGVNIAGAMVTARSPRKNPFHAFAKFKGRAARLRAWEGGFHTALKRDLVIPYAQMKWDNDPDDYPVILTFDMTGLTRFTDIDVRRAADMFFEHCAVSQYRVGREDVDSEQILDSLSLDLENTEDEGAPESGDDALNAMWSLSGSPSVRENALHQAIEWIGGSGLRLEYLYDIGKRVAKDERVMLEPREEEMLIKAFGQCRYMFDIPDDRLIKVEYMAPFFAQVIDPDGGDDDDTLKEAAEAGYSFVETDRTELYEHRTKAWERSRSELPLLEATVGRSRTSRSWEQQRIEFHGTSLRNLLSAVPWLADVLPDPPSPCMSGIADILEVMQSEKPAETPAEDDDDILW